MVYVALCDDNEKDLLNLQEKVLSILKKNLISANLSVYQRPEFLKYDIEEGKWFDLILSDITMPKIDGISLGKYVHLFLPETLLVYVTTHIEHCPEAFEIPAFRYLIKNKLEERLEPAILDAIHVIEERTNFCYQIHNKNRKERIPYKKILYIVKEEKKCSVFIKG